MTLTEIADQLYDLSSGGCFNHRKYTAGDWRRHVKALMSQPEIEKSTKTVVQEITLPDGDWLFTISCFLPNIEYDYYIPETREDEQWLKENYKKI